MFLNDWNHWSRDLSVSNLYFYLPTTPHSVRESIRLVSGWQRKLFVLSLAIYFILLEEILSLALCFTEEIVISLGVCVLTLMLSET